MQLTRERRWARVGAISASILFVGAARAQAPATIRDAPAPAAATGSDYVVRASSEVGAYADSDHVFVLTPSIAASVAKPTAGVRVDASYLVDVISAASVDIVSTASRRWEEVRQAGTLAATYQPGSLGVSGQGAVSVEPDYVSWAGGIVLTQDLLSKNVTLLVGYQHGRDVAGRTGTPFSVYSHAIDLDGVKAGASVVLDRATIGTAMVDADFVNGDTSKPYRYIPLFAPGVQVSPGASIDTVNALRLSARVLEQVPRTRSRYALTMRVAHRFRASTLRLEERLYDDTWGLKASSTDARFLADVSRRVELGPHARVHGQTAVDFWQLAYVLRAGPQTGLDFPAYRTGDRELGPLVNLTAGGTLRVGVGPDRAPTRWTLGFDLGATYSRYLDDLYLTGRLSTLGALSLEGEL
jgi:Protein of unknown function (DUF3570)